MSIKKFMILVAVSVVSAVVVDIVRDKMAV